MMTFVDTDADAVTVRILRAVAAADGRDPTDLDPPLATVIDPDAVASLVDDADDSVRVTFRYAGHDVRVTGAGTVRVDGGPARADC